MRRVPSKMQDIGRRDVFAYFTLAQATNENNSKHDTILEATKSKVRAGL